MAQTISETERAARAAAGRARHQEVLAARLEKEERALEYLRNVMRTGEIRDLAEGEGEYMLSLVTRGKATALVLRALLAHQDLPTGVLERITSRNDFVDGEVARLLLEHPNRNLAVEIGVVKALGTSSMYILEGMYGKETKGGFRSLTVDFVDGLELTADEMHLVKRLALMWGDGAHDDFVRVATRAVRADPAAKEVLGTLLDDDGAAYNWQRPSHEKRRKIRAFLGISENV